MRRSIPSSLLMTVFAVFLAATAARVHGQQDEVTFVSAPDFYNFDIPDPMPTWDDANDWFLSRVKAEDPDRVLVAGDLVLGEWYESSKAIDHMGLVYYEAWNRRMKRHQLTYMPAIGDHEIGDDAWPPKKAKVVPKFKEVFKKYLDIPAVPDNAIPGNKLVSYYERIGNVLFITVDTFEKHGKNIKTTVSGKQLNWLKNVLKTFAPKTEFIVVQGHVPVVGNDLKATSSSQITLNGGRNSEFWQLMKAAGVDLYLCGEFHALNADRVDGIWQIVHGTSWGRKGHVQTYLVGNTTPNQLSLTLKSFPLDVGGDTLWNMNKGNGPREMVRIPQSVRRNGPEVKGTITIQKQGNQERSINASGVFKK